MTLILPQGADLCEGFFAEITDRKAREEPGRKNGTGHAPEQAQVVIDGGIGVGRVTKPGLDQPVGNAAINHVPREMIEREVLQVCQVFGLSWNPVGGDLCAGR